MKRLSSLLASAVLAGATLAALPLATGCAGEGSYVVEDDVPPPQDEVVVARPGFIWVHGHWNRDGGRWAWRGGYYERERPNQVYAEGRWERRGRGHVWVDGGWHARGGVVVRDHR
jgi:hypothetical protein